MKVTLAQINPIVGDIEGNIGLMKAAIATAEQQESDLIIFSECVLTGYPPRDLLGKPWFLKQITKKPVQPSLNEITKNHRSRSAKLRVAERTNTPFLNTIKIPERKLYA